MLSSDPLILSRLPVSGPPVQGYFFSYRPKTQDTPHTDGGYQCRESFAVYFASHPSHVAFSYPRGSQAQAKVLDALLTSVETMLKVKVPSVVHPTLVGGAKDPSWSTVIIKVSPFWRASYTTREVLTLLVRCGLIHARHGDTVEVALKRYPLAASTIPALLFFFAGYTTCPNDTTMAGRFVYNTGEQWTAGNCATPTQYLKQGIKVDYWGKPKGLTALETTAARLSHMLVKSTDKSPEWAHVNH